MPKGTCPDCGADIHINEDADKGDSVECNECEMELIVVGLDPIELDIDENEDYDDEEEEEEY